MKQEEEITTRIMPDFSDPEEVRKAFLASEIFQRKY